MALPVKPLAFILIVMAALAASGCICNPILRFVGGMTGINDFGFLSSEYNNFDYTIDDGQYACYGYNFSRGENVVFRIKTDGSPIDFMVVDEPNLEKYKRAVAGENVTWGTYLTRTGVAGDQAINFTAPKNNTAYYYVLDNTGRIPGGTWFGHPVDIIGETKAGLAISSNVGGTLNGIRVNVDKGSIGNKDSKSYTHTVDHYSYESYGANLTRGTVLHISLNSGKPVDLLVIDKGNLTGYEDAVRNGEGRFNASMLETSVTAGNYEFTAPYRDDFYLIVDNTVVPEGGAYANDQVSFEVSGNYDNGALQY
jgi:hypothetical protein